MTDRELLELAAKANGGLVYVEDMGWIFEDEQGNRGAWWSSLTDDGDALRLAVSLKLALFTSDKWCEAIRSDIPVCAEATSNDPNKAMRRAITRAAAEIGKAMP